MSANKLFESLNPESKGLSISAFGDTMSQKKLKSLVKTKTFFKDNLKPYGIVHKRNTSDSKSLYTTMQFDSTSKGKFITPFPQSANLFSPNSKNATCKNSFLKSSNRIGKYSQDSRQIENPIESNSESLSSRILTNSLFIPNTPADIYKSRMKLMSSKSLLDPRTTAENLQNWVRELSEQILKSGDPDSLESYLKGVNAVFEELAREIGENCKEQKVLLINLWKSLMKIVDELLHQSNKKFLSKDKYHIQHLNILHHDYQHKLEDLRIKLLKAEEEIQELKKERGFIVQDSIYCKKKLIKTEAINLEIRKKFENIRKEIIEQFSLNQDQRKRILELEHQISESTSNSQENSKTKSRKQSMMNFLYTAPQNSNSSIRKNKQSMFGSNATINMAFSGHQLEIIDINEGLDDQCYYDEMGVTYNVFSIGVNTDDIGVADVSLDTKDLILIASKGTSVKPESYDSMIQTIDYKLNASTQYINPLTNSKGNHLESEEFLKARDLFKQLEKGRKFSFSFESFGDYESIGSSEESRIDVFTGNSLAFGDESTPSRRKGRLNSKKRTRSPRVNKKKISWNSLSGETNNKFLLRLQSNSVFPSKSQPQSKIQSNETFASISKSKGNQITSNYTKTLKKLHNLLKKQSTFIIELSEMLLKATISKESDHLSLTTAQKVVEKGQRYRKHSFILSNEVKAVVTSLVENTKKFRIKEYEDNLRLEELQEEADKHADLLSRVWEEYSQNTDRMEAENANLEESKLQSSNSMLSPAFKSRIEPIRKNLQLKDIGRTTREVSPQLKPRSRNSPKITPRLTINSPLQKKKSMDSNFSSFSPKASSNANARFKGKNNEIEDSTIKPRKSKFTTTVIPSSQVRISSGKPRKITESRQSSSERLSIIPFKFAHKKVVFYKISNVNSEAALKILNKEFSSKTKSSMQKPNALKLIREIYNEKLRQSRGIEKSNPLHIVAYEYFLNKYGIRQISENKFNHFLDSTFVYREEPKAQLFLRFLGISGIENTFDYDDFEYFIHAASILDEGRSLVSNPFYANPPIKITYEKLADSLSKIMKEELDDNKEMNLLNELGQYFSADFADFDDILFGLMKIRVKRNEEGLRNLKEVYLAGDVDNDSSIDFNEFLMIFRNLEPSFSFERTALIFYGNADLIEEESQEVSMTFGIFAKTAVNCNVLSKESQLKFTEAWCGLFEIEGLEKFEGINGLADLREAWYELSHCIKEILMETGNYTKFYLKMFKKLDSFVSSPYVTPKSGFATNIIRDENKETDEKTIWLIFRLLCEECLEKRRESIIKALLPVEFDSIEELYKELFLNGLKMTKRRDSLE